MIMIAACGGKNSRTAERVVQTVEAELEYNPWSSQ